MLPTDNVREGVLEYETYRLVRDALPGYARIALVIAFHTGARKGEIAAIRKDRIDLKAERITLPGKTTKNASPSYLPVYGDMKAELDMVMAAGSSDCPFLIQRAGVRVHDWKKAWATACKTAEVPEALFHDLRRTAVTNMIEAGLTEKEAMEISGHKTRAVFDQYHIASDRRMKANAQKLADHLKAAEEDAGEDKKRPSSNPVKSDTKNDGEPGGTRTRDHRIKSAMLYQLSYRPIHYLQGISKLDAAFGVRHGLLGLFQPLQDQSTCEGMTKAMSSEISTPTASAGRWQLCGPCRSMSRSGATQ